MDKKTIIGTSFAQTWRHRTGLELITHHFGPWGMKQYFHRILNNDHVKKHSFLPTIV